jgi:lipopolysaccharide/colanic/teichoic acid biosynthesis glycosyltransferase
MYDLYYIKNWSIWLEIEICIKTVMVILDKKGF